jgi:hypothetical protein
MAAGRLQQSALLRHVSAPSAACFEPAGAGGRTARGDGRAVAQVFAHVAKQCLHSPAVDRAAAGQCSTSSFARSAKLQRRPYNFYREEVPSDPQAQARPTRLRAVS